MIITEIQERLQSLSDISYRDFQSKLIPTVDKGFFIGVRTPILRSLAKELSTREDIGDFLSALPHKYFDEYQLHAFVISLIKDFGECIAEVERFLPYVDNWATCDQMSPKAFKKHRGELLGYVNKWIKSSETYTVRFAVKMLMEHFLDEDFDPKYPEMVSEIRSDEYYVNMMSAWYFATALAKQYESVLPFILENRLDLWTHNKAIQKSVESRRITDAQKAYLRTLKRKK